MTGMTDVAGVEDMTGMEDMTEVEDMTGTGDVTGTKDVENDVRKNKGVRLRWFLLHQGGKLEDFSITWFCDRALISGRKFQDMFIHPLKGIQMIKLGKSVMAALLMVALLAALFCCQKNEGPAERTGKQIDKAVEKAGEQIEKAGKKFEDAAKGADKK
jgi:hypothetical protein